MKIPELLAPVGSLEHLKIAINAGASAVYLSGKNYGARKFAENFTLDEIKEATRMAHLYNVKIYITVNTLIKESEISEVMDYLAKLHQSGSSAAGNNRCCIFKYVLWQNVFNRRGVRSRSLEENRKEL